MAGLPSPIPAQLLDGFSRVLSPTADAGALVLPCGKDAPPSLATAVPCDLDTLEVSVSTGNGDDVAIVSAIVPASAMAERCETIDVVCGVRPISNLGAGEKEDRKSLRLVRNPARVSVTATYAAKCGQNLHPGIRIEPQDGKKAICMPQATSQSSINFEAFRLRTSLETSKLLLKGGSFLPVVSAIWAAVEEDSSAGSVLVRSDSCGIRHAGPCIGGAQVRIQLHAEDEVALTFKIPPMLGANWSRARKIGREEGELRVDKDNRKQDAKVTDGHTREMLLQVGPDYAKQSRTGKDATQSRSADAQWETAESWRNETAGDLAGERFGAQQLAVAELKQRGFDFTFSHNGDEAGLEQVASALKFFGALLDIHKTIDRFRALWEAGPGVQVAVGWRAEWGLQFAQVSGSAKWSRKLKGRNVVCRREGSISLMLASGSATASCGLLVVIERFSAELVNIDYSVSIRVGGSITRSKTFSQERILPTGEWTAQPTRHAITGELAFTLRATGKVKICGRTVGTELAAECGIKGEATLDLTQGVGLQEAKIARSPLVFSVCVWIGSTGEVDYRYTQELIAGDDKLYVYPPA